MASPSIPLTNTAVAFVDGQNLFNAAKAAFGYRFPNYDIGRLAQLVCNQHGWQLLETRFYTGIPDAMEDPGRHGFWSAKCLAMRRQGITVFTRPLRYANKNIRCPDGSDYPIRFAEEKGIDVRIALDIIQSAQAKAYDVALLFSQDQDFSEVAKEIRAIAQQQSRWIKIASAFPVGVNQNQRGVNSTDWIKIDKAAYDSCIDQRAYRSSPPET